MDEPALVSLTFDDGLRCQFERAVPILDRHGFPATFFLTANKEPVHESWRGPATKGWWKIDWRDEDISKLKTMILGGHEVGSHSVTHHAATMQQNPDGEARKSKELIECWLEPTVVSSFAYPYYHSHSYLASAVRNAGYEQARGGLQASHYTLPDDASLDRFNIDCRQITTNENVGGWLRAGCWHVLTFHGIGGEKEGWAPITVEQFATQMAELAELRASGAVEVVTFNDGAARFRRPK
jgi:peptidoglycan/xylan/chitin deacetylase (PgdA/CDA1 family)